jgi:hypothetical protein
MTEAASQVGLIEHIVVPVLANRSIDHVLGFVNADSANVSPVTKPPPALIDVVRHGEKSANPPIPTAAPEPAVGVRV